MCRSLLCRHSRISAGILPILGTQQVNSSYVPLHLYLGVDYAFDKAGFSIFEIIDSYLYCLLFLVSEINGTIVKREF